ncbi:endonuclease/exonuclease/phosphatase family protein [Halomarina litorea]|uniref:endonuclease/exonuclease/phosphatase family protein n=1 Tax=Halomarina litorea TaxID=2961595 RepID=UPI0020C1CA70|nr:endonuclease/exonuclease/phosphatase family protein [Halomarina sp. BCD28]
MDTTHSTTGGTSRRALLRGSAAACGLLLGGRTLVGVGSGATGPVTAMTRNCYVGTDLFRLFESGLDLDPRRVYERYAELSASAVETRLAAIAAEILANGPSVVGLQEVALVRTQEPSDHAGGDPNASRVDYDFLASLEARLGGEYHVAASVVTADEEFPAEGEGRRLDVRLTDRDVLLVRRGVDVRATDARRYRYRLSFRAGDGTLVTVHRGYCLARLQSGGLRFTAVNTHLEAASAVVRYLQAYELRRDLGSTGDPTILLGDFNAPPGDATYGLLTRSYRDAWADADSGTPGPTCCQAADLRNEESLLSRRVDGVFYRAGDAREAARVGSRTSDRVAAGDGTRVWPSDHAGVVATLGL